MGNEKETGPMEQIPQQIPAAYGGFRRRQFQSPAIIKLVARLLQHKFCQRSCGRKPNFEHERLACSPERVCFIAVPSLYLPRTASTYASHVKRCFIRAMRSGLNQLELFITLLRASARS